MTRGQRILEKGGKLRFTTVDAGYYLIEHLDALGWFARSFDGMAPISYTEIVSYDPTLSYWERRTLYRMSLGFCDGNHVGKQTLGVFPGDERQVEED